MNNIKGLDSLFKKIEKLNVNINNTLEKSITKNMKETVQAEAKLLCPVDTTDLRESIEIKTEIRNNTVTGIVYTNSGHAPYVEFGSGKVGQDTPVADKYPGQLAYKQDKWLVNIPDVGLRYIAGQPAQPFLYPALKNNKDKIVDEIKNDLKASIKGVVK